MSNKFPKSEKLKLKRHIGKLYKQGHTIYSFPLYVKFIKADSNLCGVSVPKQKIKKAVDRNKIKRQMREAYRLHKYNLLEHELTFHMMFIYTTSQKLRYPSIEKAMQTLLQKIKNFNHEAS